MAYTVNHLYKKVLEGTDKLGVDLFTIPYVMNRLQTATYDFIGKTVKYIENTQEIRDDLRTLYKPFKIAIIADPENLGFKVITLPTDYLHLMSVKVIEPGVEVRETTLIRNGQDEIYMVDPDTKPTAKYPIVSVYSDYIRIYSPGNPTHLSGYYVKKPVFGNFSVHDDLDSEIAVNLPDQTVEQIIKNIVNDIFVATADPRAEVQFRSRETFRER